MFRVFTPILILFLTLISFSSRATISLEGVYFGKNLIIQNPEAFDGFGFCVNRVSVNGDVYPGVIAKSVFEIDFSFFQLSIGEPLFIVIEHENKCTPKVLNAEVLLPISTYEVTALSCTDEGKLKWTTKNEGGKLPFVIQQFRWGKWVNVGEVAGVGGNNPNNYEFTLTPHSGINRVRIVQVDQTARERASNEVKFKSKVTEVFVNKLQTFDELKFYSKNIAVSTRYEIIDAYGNLVKKGFGNKVDCRNLLKGAYFINYDNKTETFIKL